MDNILLDLHNSSHPSPWKGGGGVGTPHMKGVGMLVGNFELNHYRRPIWAWPKLFLIPTKETMLKHRQMRKLGLYEWSE